MLNFSVQECNWDAYTAAYNPAVVMEKFKNVFLEDK